MPKFKVTYEYRGKVAVEVEAATEEAAEMEGKAEADESINSVLSCYDVTVREI